MAWHSDEHSLTHNLPVLLTLVMPLILDKLSCVASNKRKNGYFFRYRKHKQSKKEGEGNAMPWVKFTCPPISFAASQHLSVSDDILVANAICGALNDACLASTSSDTTLDMVPSASFLFQNLKSLDWTRDTRDEVRRCVDRALTRLHPAIDSRACASSQCLVFHARQNGEHRATLQFTEMPFTSRITPFSVEGNSFVTRSTPDEAQQLMDQILAKEKHRREETKIRRQLADALLQRSFNEWMHISSCKSVFDFPSDKKRRGTLHVEPRGIVFSARIVAILGHCQALLALQLDAESCCKAASGYFAVGHVPTPSCVPTGAASTKPQKRLRNDDEQHDSFGPIGTHLIDVLGQRNVLLVDLAAEQMVVTVTAYKVFVNRNGSVEFDDCVVSGTQERCNTMTEVTAAITESCVRSKARQESFSRTLSQLQAAEVEGIQKFSKGLMDATTVYFGKSKSGNREMMKFLAAHHPLGKGAEEGVVKSGTVLQQDEGAIVEYKAGVNVWDDSNAEGERWKNKSNAERLRHTVGAFANTLGGFLVVGVNNDGVVEGQAAVDEDGKIDVRLSGFCPAMVHGAVTMKEYRVTQASDAPKTLPAGWWKSTTASTSSPSTSKQRLLRVVRVEKGTAPFYCAATGVWPSVRLTASTVAMPTTVALQRIMMQLPLADTHDKFFTLVKGSVGEPVRNTGEGDSEGEKRNDVAMRADLVAQWIQ